MDQELPAKENWLLSTGTPASQGSKETQRNDTFSFCEIFSALTHNSIVQICLNMF
jgi:hypothetical protein